eukprot:g4198.t1
MGRKRKRPDSELTPDELKRRNLQREKQKIALARQAGQHVPSKKAQKAAAWRAELAEKSKQAQEEEKQKREELGSKHDVVIVPIFWKKREEEAESIKSAARGIKARLAAHKVDCWIDQRHKYTPGQKFAYWEHLGVMLRIELGPKDIPRSTCSLCRVHEAGDYKGADRVKDVPLAGQALFDALRKLGLAKLEGKRDDNAPGSKGAAASAAADADADADLESEPEPAPEPAPEPEPEPEPATAPAPAPEPERAEKKAKEDKKAKKKKKVVKF